MSPSRLRVTVDPNGFLQVAWRRARRSVGLRFTPDRLVAVAPEGLSLDLLWSAQGAVPAVLHRRSGSCWTICHWSHREAGVGLQLVGPLALAAEPLRRATGGERFQPGGEPERGCRLPIVPGATGLRSTGAEHDTLQALTTVLARRPDLRARLGDRERVRRLAADLAGGMRRCPTDSIRTLSPGALDVALALVRCGLVFRQGRPLPGETVAEDDAMDRVRAALATQQGRGRSRPSQATIERVVRRRYLDVAPWPFAALVD